MKPSIIWSKRWIWTSAKAFPRRVVQAALAPIKTNLDCRASELHVFIIPESLKRTPYWNYFISQTLGLLGLTASNNAQYLYSRFQANPENYVGQNTHTYMYLRLMSYVFRCTNKLGT
jgi:hypothetical protein